MKQEYNLHTNYQYCSVHKNVKNNGRNATKPKILDILCDLPVCPCQNLAGILALNWDYKETKHSLKMIC